MTLDWCEEGYAWGEMTLENEEGKRKWCFQIPSLMRAFSSPEVLSLGDKWYEAPCLPPNRFQKGVERVGRETDAFLLSLGYRHDRENRCYIAEHPTDERVDVPYPLVASRFDQTCTGMTVIEFADHDGIVIPRMLELSCDAHLYAADLPTEYNRHIRF